jgi:uncharacterized membrane protein required for colicin V production
VYLDICIGALLLIFIIIGWKRGFMNGILGFISGAVSVLVAIYSCRRLADLLDSTIKFSDKMDGVISGKGYALNVLISAVVIWAVCRLVFFVIGRFIKRLKSDSRVIDKIDKFFGIFLGILQCAVLVISFFLLTYLLQAIPFAHDYIMKMFSAGVTGYEDSKFGVQLYDFVVEYIVPHTVGLVADTFHL